MMLVDVLRWRLSDAGAASFQLMGEDLTLLSGPELLKAAAAYSSELERLPPTVREPFEREQARLAGEAHRFLRRYNRSVHTRLSGYLEIGRRCQFQYPWPVVAMLGICQVLTGIGKNRVYGLIGPAASRLGLRVLEHMVESTEDVLRRTNRGIFADSMPTVMLALRVHELRQSGDRQLADALLDGPLPLLMDDESRSLAHALVEGLAIRSGSERFARLAQLTLEHFAREQAIFTYHMGPPAAREHALVKRLSGIKAVPAPVIVRSLLGKRRVAFKPFAMPPGFDMRDHDTRVRELGRAYVSSVTGDLDDYRAAVAFVTDRFGKPGERAEIDFSDR
jgi:hypothetical protein